MTIGEWIRKSGDKELAAVLMNWMLTIVMSLGLDYTKLDIITEFNEVLDYLNLTITEDMIQDCEYFKDSNMYKKFKELSENKNVIFIAHNIEFDRQMLKNV